MSFDLTAFKEKYNAAGPFVAKYQDAQLRTQVQMVYRDSKECSPGERVIIDEWLNNNSAWLVANEERYNNCLTLIALPKQDIEDLYKTYEALCGGTNDEGV